MPVPGSPKAISLLFNSGYRVAVATNQSGLARGLFDEFTLARIHQKMHELIEEEGGQIEGVFYCPHGPDEGCECRKPKTGLLEKIREEFGAPLSGCYLIGDSLRDLQAAVKFGLKPVLVRTGKGLKSEQQLETAGLSSVPVFDHLHAAVLGLGLAQDA